MTNVHMSEKYFPKRVQCRHLAAHAHTHVREMSHGRVKRTVSVSVFRSVRVQIRCVTEKLQ